MTAVHLANERALLPRIEDEVRTAESEGYDGVWVGEVTNLDAVVPAALAARATDVLDVGTLLNVFTRGRATLAMTAASLGDLAPNRMHVVLGVASPLLVERFNAMPYERPFARLRDTLRFVRRTLDGERVDGFGLADAPATPPKLLVAATGPLALRLAATEADGVVLNWISPTDVERIEPRPATTFIVVPAVRTTEWAEVEAAMRPVLGDYLNAPAYAEQQRRLGRGTRLAPMWEAWARRDRAGAHAAVPSDIIDELVVWGTADECRSRFADIEARTGARAIATWFRPA